MKAPDNESVRRNTIALEHAHGDDAYAEHHDPHHAFVVASEAIGPTNVRGTNDRESPTHLIRARRTGLSRRIASPVPDNASTHCRQR